MARDGRGIITFLTNSELRFLTTPPVVAFSKSSPRSAYLIPGSS